MDDSSSLLATLAQSSAAIVAIIGGFLVSRLVALSSEREGIKRQLQAARDRSTLYRAEYEPVHEYRLANSVATMRGRLIDKLIDERPTSKDKPLEELIEEGGVPRGSSVEELFPFAQRTRERVDAVFEAIVARTTEDDDNTLELDELKARGLLIPGGDEELYESVFARVREELHPPSRRRSIYGIDLGPVMEPLRLGSITPGWRHEVEMRRLDESIRDEQELRAQLTASEREVERLGTDLKIFAQPVGVVSAVWILALFSLLGIVAPILAMAFGPDVLPLCWTIALIAAFVVGLAAVLAYIIWYLRKVGPEDESTDGDEK